MKNNPSWLTTHQQFVQYGRNAKEWTRKCIFLLPEIQKQQIWKKKRFRDIYDYARKLAGMSYNQVNEALRVLSKTENLPALRRVIEEKGINSVKPVVTIATPATDKFWAEKSHIMGQHPLEVYVKEFRRLQSINGLRAEAPQSVDLHDTTSTHASSESQTYQPESAHPRNAQQSFSAFLSDQSVHIHPQATIVLQLDPQIADQLQKIKGQSDWNETIGELLKLRQEKLDQNKPAIVETKGLDVGTTPRAIPAAIKNYVLTKANGTCAFPGCYKPYEILHHTDRFAMFHVHDPDHIFPLCMAHERLAHLGLIENEDLEPQFWKIIQQPDYHDPKYEIDKIVDKFRQPKS